MVVSRSAFKVAAFSSLVALCLSTHAARAQAGGSGGSSGAAAGGAGAGGAPVGGSAGAATGGMTASGGTATGGTGGTTPVNPANLISNGAFDSDVTDPWWTYANNTDENPADETIAVNNGQLCATMTTGGGKNVWDVILGVSGLSLLPNQYYHISFTASADADRAIKFKVGLGDKPYTDYFIEQIPISATPATFDYTYLNLRTDPMAQFQFQIGKTTGTVCIDNVVVEPVAAPTMPVYKTPFPSGHPFKDYKSLVKMGTAVDTPIFLSSPLHNAIVAGEFSMITPANSMKMNLIQPVQGTFDFTDTDALVAWAQANGLEFRGHPLVWHTQAPDWVTGATFSRDELIAIMYAHIDGVMSHYVGKFPYWDVVNEAIDQVDGGWGFRKTFWHETIGDDFINLAFARAHAADPAAKLYYNDYNIEQKGNAKADKVFEMIKGLKAAGVPIDGVGFQGHYYVEPNGSTSVGLPKMQAIIDNMARYNDIGIDVQITESDFRIGKPLDDAKTQVQNKFYADFLQACIDATNCSHFTVWGLSDVDSWVPSTFPEYDYAHLWDSKLMPKADALAVSAVFAKYNVDGTPIGGSVGTGGAPSGAGGATASGGSGASPATANPSSGSGDSSGCSFVSRAGGLTPLLLSGFVAIGALASRRRRKSARSGQR